MPPRWSGTRFYFSFPSGISGVTQQVLDFVRDPIKDAFNGDAGFGRRFVNVEPQTLRSRIHASRSSGGPTDGTPDSIFLTTIELQEVIG